jgi:SAM-dependent methyltransferase
MPLAHSGAMMSESPHESSAAQKTTHADAVSFVPVPACWICGGTSFRPMDVAPFELTNIREQDPELYAYTGASVRVMQCQACGFGQPEKVPALPNYFARLYDVQWGDDFLHEEFTSAYKDLIFDRILDGFQSRLGPGRRKLLDIGAHAGRFIHLAAKRGMQPEGVELNPRTSAFAARMTGLPVHRLNALDLAAQGHRYDAVAMTDVLEHIPEPMQILEKIHTLLSPGGWISIVSPNGRAQWIKQRVIRRIIHRRTGLLEGIADNLVHVNQFSPRSLALALTRAGFTDVSIEVGAPTIFMNPTPMQRFSNLQRLGVWRAARLLPGSTRTPLALNLHAFARRA